MLKTAVRRVRATRYVTPLREGGSLPAIVEADDDGLYVLKFRGAGKDRWLWWRSSWRVRLGVPWG